MQNANYLVEIDVDFFEHFVENRYKMIGILECEDHWRLQFQNVIVGPVAADKNLLLLHPRYHVLCLCRRRYPFNSVAYQFDADEQSSAAYVADNPPSFRQFLQFCEQMIADFQGVLLKALPFHDFHHCVRHCARHGIAPILK